MNVSLTPELEKFVNEKVSSGMYYSASEVIREGLRLLKEQEQLRAIKLEELRKDIQIGIDQLDQGEFTTYTSAHELAEEIKATARKKRAAKNKNNT